MFGVGPRSLPGLVVFEALPDQTTRRAIYIPIELSWFNANTEQVENFLADIYSTIQEAFDANKGKDKPEFIADLRRRLRRHQDKEKQRIRLSAIADKLEPLSELTQKVGAAFAQAVAEAVVKKW